MCLFLLCVVRARARACVQCDFQASGGTTAAQCEGLSCCVACCSDTQVNKRKCERARLVRGSPAELGSWTSTTLISRLMLDIGDKQPVRML